jgi:hypothetical protein
MRLPNPTEVIRVAPVAIRRQLFRAPNVFVVIIRAVTKPLREVTFAIVHPLVNRIRRSRKKLPVACSVAIDDEFRRPAVAQRKPRRVRINPRAASLAHGQPHTPITRHVDAIKPRLLGRHRRSRRVHLEIFFISIKLEQAQHRRAFQHTQRDAFIAQSYDSQRSVGRETHIIPRVHLDFHPALFVGSDDVALDERIIDPGAFPVCVAVAFEVHIPGD